MKENKYIQEGKRERDRKKTL